MLKANKKTPSKPLKGKKVEPYAKNFIELGEALGLTRQYLNSLNKLPDSPKTSSNGYHDVEAWQKFLAKRSDARKLNDSVAVGQGQLKERKLAVEIEEKRFNLDVKKGLYILASDVEKEWTTRWTKFKTALYSKFEMEMPPLQEGKTAAEIMKMNHTAITLLLESMVGVTDEDEEELQEVKPEEQEVELE